MVAMTVPGPDPVAVHQPPDGRFWIFCAAVTLELPGKDVGVDVRFLALT
jgi:hypothetical protein